MVVQTAKYVDPMIARIRDLYQRIDTVALKHSLDDCIGVKKTDIGESLKSGASHISSVKITIEIFLNFGIKYDLEALITDTKSGYRSIGSGPKRQKLAELFVAYMRFLQARAEQTAERRKSIARIANEVTAEAALKGIELELFKIDTAPTRVRSEPEAGPDPSKVFYVYIIMPHDDKGVLTKAGYMIDAGDPQEFGEYLRDYTVPELIALKSRFTPLAA